MCTQVCQHTRAYKYSNIQAFEHAHTSIPTYSSVLTTLFLIFEILGFWRAHKYSNLLMHAEGI